jgi:hypothetical protein
MAKEKQSELDVQTELEIYDLLCFIGHKQCHETEREISRLAEKLKDKPEAIHHILTGENGEKVGLTLAPIRTDVILTYVWGFTLLNAALPKTYSAMQINTKRWILQWACKSNNPSIVKNLLSALSEDDIIELLNSDIHLFTANFISLPQQGELIETLFEHFPFDRVTEVHDNSLVFYVYAALVKEDAAHANKLISRLPPQRLGIILGEVACDIRMFLREAPNIRNNAYSIIIKFMTADDVTAAEKGSTFSSIGLEILTEGAINHGRGDLVNAIMYQKILGDKPRFDLLGDYFSDTVRYAARYGQIDILTTALACYACYGQKKVDVCVNELAAKQELPKETQALLTDYSKLDSPLRRTIEQIKVLMMERGMSPSEAFAWLKKPVSLPSSSLSSSSTTSSSTTTVSQSTAGGTISWADDEDIAAISHVKDDHKARKASPKTSWQQRHEDSRSATHSTSSSQVSSNHTRSQRLAASSEQNVVTESANSTGIASEAGWHAKRAKVNKGPASSLNR